MGQLREKMEADLKIGGYSPNTQRIYLRHARSFAAYFMRSPAELGADQVREFLLHLVQDQGASRETIGQVRAALRFLYVVTLNRPVEIEWLPVPRRQKRLPVVLSGTEVTTLLGQVQRLKYRLIFTLMYSGGLRISEACKLRPEDIDSKRMLIRVLGKGDKQRCTLLSRRLLPELRDYCRLDRPARTRLFPGGTPDGHLSREAVTRVFREAFRATGIAKDATPHALRHSFATHLIDTGTSIAVVQALLGHASLETTELYTHVSATQIARTRSPLDLLGTPAAAVLG